MRIGARESSSYFIGDADVIADRSLVLADGLCAAIKNQFLCESVSNSHENRQGELICYANPLIGNTVIGLTLVLDVALRCANGGDII